MTRTFFTVHRNTLSLYSQIFKYRNFFLKFSYTFHMIFSELWDCVALYVATDISEENTVCRMSYAYVCPPKRILGVKIHNTTKWKIMAQRYWVYSLSKYWTLYFKTASHNLTFRIFRLIIPFWNYSRAYGYLVSTHKQGPEMYLRFGRN